jgi:hypothetical protein
MFTRDIPLNVYLWMEQSQKAVDSFLLSEAAGTTPQERTSLRFHLSMIAAANLLGARVHNPVQLQSIAAAGTPITEVDLKARLALLKESLSARVDETGDGPDKIVKGHRFVDILLERALPNPDVVG